MPFFDLNTLENIEAKTYDFTVIGAGAAGILLAVKLTQKGHSVRLIESGDIFEDPKLQQLNEVKHTAKYFT